MKKCLLYFSLLLINLSAFGQSPDYAISPTIIAPTNGCSLSNTENITVVMVNTSAFPGSGTFEFGYSENAGTPVIESTTIGFLNGTSTYIYTFSSAVDFSSCQLHDLVVWVNEPNDPNNANDTLSVQITSDCPATSGTISGPVTNCTYAAGILDLTGYAGTIQAWESSSDGGVSWTTYPTTNDFYDFSSATPPLDIRVIVNSTYGICDPDTTTVFSLFGPAVPTAMTSNDTTINAGDTIAIWAGGGASYTWGPNYNISNTSSSNPSVWPLTDTTYSVVVVDTNGCSDTAYIDISVIGFVGISEEDGSELIIPTVISSNTPWIIQNLSSYPDNDLTIYNLNGQVVHRAFPYMNNWNADELSSGIYIFEIKLNSEIEKTIRGRLSVVR